MITDAHDGEQSLHVESHFPQVQVDESLDEWIVNSSKSINVPREFLLPAWIRVAADTSIRYPSRSIMIISAIRSTSTLSGIYYHVLACIVAM